MLSIRLSRRGKKKQPFYRVIICEKTKDPWGDYLENLGNYNPRTKELNLKADRIKYWLDKGAQPSDTVWNFLIEKGIVEGKKRTVTKISKKRLAKKESPPSHKATEGKEAKSEEPKAEPAAEEETAEMPASTTDLVGKGPKGAEEKRKETKLEEKPAETLKEEVVEKPAEEQPSVDVKEKKPQEKIKVEESLKAEKPAEKSKEEEKAEESEAEEKK